MEAVDNRRGELQASLKVELDPETKEATPKRRNENWGV